MVKKLKQGNNKLYVPTRFKIVAGTFLLSLILYIDRIFISVAKDPIVKDLSLTDKQMGWVLSIFALGYAFFQTPSGMLADRFGPRKVLSAVVTLWSVFTALTGATWNFLSLMFVRFVFGVGEAGAFPSFARSIYSWIPMTERTFVHGMNFAGGRVGSAIALMFTPLLISSIGWRSSFAILGIIGIIWAVIWFFWYKDTPEEHQGILEKEKQFIIENRQSGEQVKDRKGISFITIIKSKNMWFTMSQFFSYNFTFFFAITWLYPYIKKKYNLEFDVAGMYASLTLFAGALGNWFSGAFSDWLYRRGKWSLSRKLPATIGFIIASTALFISPHMPTVMGAVILLSLVIFGADMTLSPSWALCVDIGQENSGAVSGTMNMAGNLGSFATALAFPYIVAWTSSTYFFYVCAILNIIAIGFWWLIKVNKRIEEY